MTCVSWNLGLPPHFFFKFTMTKMTKKTKKDQKTIRQKDKITKIQKDIWDTDYNSGNWEPEFMTIFVIRQLRVTWTAFALLAMFLHNSSNRTWQVARPHRPLPADGRESLLPPPGSWHTWHTKSRLGCFVSLLLKESSSWYVIMTQKSYNIQ